MPKWPVETLPWKDVLKRASSRLLRSMTCCRTMPGNAAQHFAVIGELGESGGCSISSRSLPHTTPSFSSISTTT